MPEKIPGIGEKEQVLDDITAKYAYEILKKLANEDAKILKRVQELALEYLIEVDPDHIAKSIFNDLVSLDVEELWKNSGRTRYGYVDPYELASEMFEEALEPYVEELRKCQKLGMDEEAKFHCMGILKGLYMFEKGATTEFQDWAVDDSHNNFIHIFEEWRKGNNEPKNLEEMEEMDEFVKKNFPKWYNVKKSSQFQI